MEPYTPSQARWFTRPNNAIARHAARLTKSKNFTQNALVLLGSAVLDLQDPERREDARVDLEILVRAIAGVADGGRLPEVILRDLLEFEPVREAA